MRGPARDGDHKTDALGGLVSTIAPPPLDNAKHVASVRHHVLDGPGQLRVSRA